VLIAYFALSSLFIVIFALGVNLDVVNGALAGARLFGQSVDVGGRSIEIDKLVLGFESGFSAFLYLVGTFLALFATAHLVPRLQEKGTIDLYLSRPVGRVALLLSRYAGGLLLAAANLLYLIGSMWLIVVWKTRVFHPRFLLSGLVILFAVATLLAFAFLIGVVTSSTGVSLMATYAVFFLSAILVARERIAAAVSTETAARIVKGLYWILPKTAEIGQATVALVAGKEAPARLADVHYLAVYGSTAAFGVAALALSAWLFSRKDF
jgi:ABC-type transport system involved in multi-copper enzyme maturation permease subunit